MKPTRHEPKEDQPPMGGRNCPLLDKPCAGAECAWWDKHHTVDGVQGNCIILRVYEIRSLLGGK